MPTPATVVCERYDDAMDAFKRLGGDVVVKPLFGAMGNGIVRVEDRDVAHRVFRALELERTVYYVQQHGRAVPAGAICACSWSPARWPARWSGSPTRGGPTSRAARVRGR